MSHDRLKLNSVFNSLIRSILLRRKFESQEIVGLLVGSRLYVALDG